MAVKFSDFTQKQDASVDVTNMVGYLATGELNIMIPPANLDTTYAVSTGNAGASPTISIQGTKPGQAAAIAPSTVSLTGSGATLLAGNGTTTIDFASTTYALAAGVNADPAVNTPVTLTGLAGGDAHTDTVNLIGTGTVQITSAGGVITIDGGSTGDVTSFSSTFGNYITGTTQTNAVGDVSIGTVNLSAIDGTSDANTKFLSKDNTWDVPTYTTYDLETTTVANGQTNVPVTLASAAGDDTLNLLGAGTVTIGSDSGTGLITITGGGVGDVTSIDTATSGVSTTANPITLTGTAGAGPFTGDITVASNAFAGGANVGHVPSAATAVAGTFLKEDGSWAAAAGDTYTLQAGAKAGTSVPIQLDAAAGADSTVSLTEGTGITLTQNSATEITIASAAGVTMTTSPAATGDGATATYPLGATPTDENFTMAYISGVYQLKSSYSVTGSNITFDTNVPNGASIEVVTTT
jgi:hypothetical protein